MTTCHVLSYLSLRKRHNASLVLKSSFYHRACCFNLFFSWAKAFEFWEEQRVKGRLIHTAVQVALPLSLHNPDTKLICSNWRLVETVASPIYSTWKFSLDFSLLSILTNGVMQMMKPGYQQHVHIWCVLSILYWMLSSPQTHKVWGPLLTKWKFLYEVISSSY